MEGAVICSGAACLAPHFANPAAAASIPSSTWSYGLIVAAMLVALLIITVDEAKRLRDANRAVKDKPRPPPDDGNEPPSIA